MKNLKRRVSALALTSVFAFSVSTQKINAEGFEFSFKRMAENMVAQTVSYTMPRILFNTYEYIKSMVEKILLRNKINKFKGFKDPNEIMHNLEDIVNNKSRIRIYGQEKAKKQMLEALSGVIARIDNLKRHPNNSKEIRGNIVYLIGKPGTGKSKMCDAIAEAFLKNPKVTSIFCHSENIESTAELGTQLFKTVMTKDIGEKRTKNIFSQSDGIVPKEEESPMLKHLLNWKESVVIIDEYEKMKLKSNKSGGMTNYGGVCMPNLATKTTDESKMDNSADEILRSIASTGKYRFMNKEIDCSKVLFLVTTNETREEVEKNFGISGINGGGAQRLNIIEFDELNMGACKGIALDLVKNVKSVLTDKQGPFKLKDVVFNEECIDAMAKYIFENKTMQGRTKNILEDKIYELFAKSMGKDTDKTSDVKFILTEKIDNSYFEKENL